MSQEKSLPDQSTVAVVGLGLLGRGIATCFLGHGFRVIGCDRDTAAHEIADSYIDRGLSEMVTYAGIDASLAGSWRSRYHATTAFDDWPRCDFVVESVNEDLPGKQEVFDQVERVVAPYVPIGSNTSAIPITQLQEPRQHPQRFFGMHWFEPAYATRFLELIPGEHTSREIMATAAAISRRCGKEPSVLEKDIAGFIVNRIGYAMFREALNLLELGVADAETIDRSVRNALGVWSTICGPFQWIDLTGGPALYAQAMARVLPTLSTATEPPPPLRRLIDGQARDATNASSFYVCSPEERERHAAQFHAHAWRAYAIMNEYFPLKNQQSCSD
jgi:3-hydroxybutyryl-CoA dehydrogenase